MVEAPSALSTCTHEHAQRPGLLRPGPTCLVFSAAAAASSLPFSSACRQGRRQGAQQVCGHARQGETQHGRSHVLPAAPPLRRWSWLWPSPQPPLRSPWRPAEANPPGGSATCQQFPGLTQMRHASCQALAMPTWAAAAAPVAAARPRSAAAAWAAWAADRTLAVAASAAPFTACAACSTCWLAGACPSLPEEALSVPAPGPPSSSWASAPAAALRATPSLPPWRCSCLPALPVLRWRSLGVSPAGRGRLVCTVQVVRHTPAGAALQGPATCPGHRRGGLGWWRARRQRSQGGRRSHVPPGLPLQVAGAGGAMRGCAARGRQGSFMVPAGAPEAGLVPAWRSAASMSPGGRGSPGLHGLSILQRGRKPGGRRQSGGGQRRRAAGLAGSLAAGAQCGCWCSALPLFLHSWPCPVVGAAPRAWAPTVSAEPCALWSCWSTRTGDAQPAEERPRQLRPRALRCSAARSAPPATSMTLGSPSASLLDP